MYIKWIFQGVCISLLLIANIEAIKYIYAHHEPKKVTRRMKNPKIVTFEKTKSGLCNRKAPDLGYHEVYTPRIENLNLKFTHASAVKALCYENITRPIESFYGLEKHLLLAIAMAETHATEFLGTPYSSAEGLCHMLAGTAKEFGLEVQSDNAVNRIRANYGNNPKKLAEFDDRFHHIKNFDAAGRMLACWINYPDERLNGRKLSPVQKGVYRWRGIGIPEHKLHSFWNTVNRWKNFFNDPKKLAKLEKSFNKHNHNLKIDGKKADFKMYIKTMQMKNQNYDLDKYIKYLKQIT